MDKKSHTEHEPRAPPFHSEHAAGAQQPFTKNRTVITIAVLAVLFIALVLALVFVRTKVVAVVNGEKITTERFENVFSLAKMTAPSTSKAAALNQTIYQVLLLQKAKDAGYSVENSEVASAIAEFEMRSGKGVDELMKTAGVSREFFMDELYGQLIIMKYLNETFGDLGVVDEETASFYKQNKQYFQRPESINVSHILVATEEEAKDIIAELEIGSDFSELALEKSIDPSAKGNKGYLGVVPKGQFVKEFEEAAYALKDGQLSDPVKSQFGWHVIFLHNKLEATSLKYLEVEESIRGLLLQQKRGQALQELLQQLYQDAEISWYLDEE